MWTYSFDYLFSLDSLVYLVGIRVIKCSKLGVIRLRGRPLPSPLKAKQVDTEKDTD